MFQGIENNTRNLHTMLDIKLKLTILINLD